MSFLALPFSSLLKPLITIKRHPGFCILRKGTQKKIQSFYHQKVLERKRKLGASSQWGPQVQTEWHLWKGEFDSRQNGWGVEQVQRGECKQLPWLILNSDGIKTRRQNPISILPVFIIPFSSYVGPRIGHLLKLITLKQTSQVVGGSGKERSENLSWDNIW